MVEERERTVGMRDHLMSVRSEERGRGRSKGDGVCEGSEEEKSVPDAKNKANI